MIRIQRANVVLDIRKDNLEYYMEKGYNQVDLLGNVVTSAIPQDVNFLKTSYERDKQQIADLQKVVKDQNNTIAELLLEISNLKAKKSKPPKEAL